MKTKPKVNPKPDRLFKAVHSVSSFLRKKKPKLLAPKKRVRFNLMTKASSSQIMLTQSRPVSTLKPDFDQGMKLKSQSCVNIAATSLFSGPQNLKALPSSQDQIGFSKLSQLKRNSKLRNLHKYVMCFNDIYFLGPLLNLHKKMPVKGILKNGEGSRDDYLKSEKSLSTKKRLLNVADKWNTKPSCNNSSSSASYIQSFSVLKFQQKDSNMDGTEVVPCSIFENVVSSIQGLHISGHSHGDQGTKLVALTPRQHNFNFVTYIPKDNSQI